MSHAKHTPSGYAKGWSLCPGQLNAISALPPELRDRDTEASRTGTRRHLLLAHMAEQALSRPGAVSRSELTWPTEILDDKTFELLPVTTEDCDLVAPVLDYVLEHPAFIHRDRDGYEVHIEKRVSYAKPIGKPEVTDDYYGTADLILITPDVLEVADAKFGRWEVDPVDNGQGKIYLLGAGDLLDFQKKHRQLRKARFTILQPTVDHPVKHWDQPLTKFLEWAKEVGAAVDATLDPNAPRIPGPDQCRFCPANGTCDARREEAAGAMFEAIGATPPEEAPAPIATIENIEELASSNMSDDTEKLDNERLARILDQADVIEQWLKNARSTAQVRLEAGQEIPGYKLVEGRRSKTWELGEAELVRKLSSLRFKKGECYQTKLQTPAALAKMATDRLTEKQLGRFNALWSWKPGKPTVATQSDSRPAIRQTPEQMFDPVNETTESTETFDWL